MGEGLEREFRVKRIKAKMRERRNKGREWTGKEEGRVERKV